MGDTGNSLASCFLIPSSFLQSQLKSILEKLIKPRPNFLKDFPVNISESLRLDSEATNSVSCDYGHLVHATPAGVFYPSSVEDIVSLVKFSYGLSRPFKIAARGRGHCVHGEALAKDGVVINMCSLNNASERIRVYRNGETRCGYVDVGGEQMWIDVLKVCLEKGVAPVSWTDYLYLTVGGTLSNAGISGQTFRYGPQISTVQELDVVTGKGELMTCSEKSNSELFFAVLGGLGQFGIITRARIPVQPAPKRVKWVRMLYDDFVAFTREQEHLISIHGEKKGVFTGLDYIEGLLIMHQSAHNNWRSSFFSSSDVSRIVSLSVPNGFIYCLEVAKYYDESSSGLGEELEALLEGLSYLPGFCFTKDVTFLEFLDRVRKGELELRSRGLWEVPHPWLNIFVPGSRISEFNSEVFASILNDPSKATGPFLLYPMLRNKWDNRMSALTPEEDVFYTLEFLHSSGFDDWEVCENQNKTMLQFCKDKGIKVKQYLPYFENKQGWRNHFGSEWGRFQTRKASFDPKMILSPGPRIFD
ncbi:Cytokinin dehydrogenase 3-like protein [Drosera capensis]